MSSSPEKPVVAKPMHPWLHTIRLAFVPGPRSPLLEELIPGLLRHFRLHEHAVQATPDDSTDLILTTASFGESISWRKSPVLTGRQRFNLDQTPVVYTLVHAPSQEFHHLLTHFRIALSKETPDPADYDFPGLASQAHRVLFEQGQRGGPILALERLVQARSKCPRVLLVVGDERPNVAYHFDLVGAHPRSVAENLDAFYDDIVLRIVTTICTSEVTEHEVVGEPIPSSLWQSLDSPKAMRTAARQLGKRHFFTPTVRINDLVNVPAVQDAVASQYSEGCFSTWDPNLGALVATVTGSARPLNSEALQNPHDPRQVTFSVLPGHGTVMAEKWVHTKAPFQVIWEYMDAGYLQVDRRIPQGPMQYVPGSDGRMQVKADWDIPGTT